MILGPLTILLVEDSPVDERVLKVLLVNAGGGLCRVEHAASLRAALQHLEREAVNVIVLDLGLDDGCGLERSRLLRIEQAGHVAARAAEQRIRDLLESVDAILWEMDFSTWTYSFVGKRAEDILGYPVSEWLETPGFLLTHLHPDDRDRLLADGQELVAGWAQSFEVRVFAADGRLVWLLGSIMHGVRDTGVSAGMLVDITARKMLELLEREQSETLAMVVQSLPVDIVLARVATLVENQCPGSCVCAVTFDEGLLAWRAGPASSRPPKGTRSIFLPET